MPEPTVVESALRYARYWWHNTAGAWRASPKPRIAFLHVPKCAGTTLTEAIEAHYPPHLVARIQTSATAEVADHTGRDLETYRQQLMWYLARSHDFLFVSGHVNFSGPMFDDLRPRWSFVTLLRNPVDRFLSSYFYRAHKPTTHAALDMSLERYVETRRARHAGAIYVRFFAGDGLREPAAERVERALRNLRRLQLVGVVEDLSSFAATFQRRYGMSLGLGRRNASPVSRSELEGIATPALRRRIAELCEPDLRIYARIRRDWGLDPTDP